MTYNRPHLCEISQEDWDYALNVLPPDEWHTDRDGVQKFLWMERYDWKSTNHFARYQGRYFSRLADPENPASWISAREIGEMLSLSSSCL